MDQSGDCDAALTHLTWPIALNVCNAVRPHALQGGCLELLEYPSSQHAAPGACGICHGANCMSGLLQNMPQSLLPAPLRRVMPCTMDNYLVQSPRFSCGEGPIAYLSSHDSLKAPWHRGGAAGYANISVACGPPLSPAAKGFNLQVSSRRSMLLRRAWRNGTLSHCFM